MNCPKCNIEMEIGKAIPSSWMGCRGIVSQLKIWTYKTLKLIDCWKCPKCGYSEEIK